MYFYDVVKNNPAFSKYTDKSFTVPIIPADRQGYLDKKELENEVKSILLRVEEQVLSAQYNINDMSTLENMEEKKKSHFGTEYKNAKDSFIRKLLSDEQEPVENHAFNETSIEKNLNLLGKKVCNGNKPKRDTLKESMKEQTIKVTQIQDHMNNMNNLIKEGIKEGLNDLALKFDNIPKLINANVNNGFGTVSKDMKCINDNIKILLKSSKVFNQRLVASFTDNNNSQPILCSMNDKELVYGSQEGNIIIFDFKKKKQLALIPGHNHKVASIFKWDDNTFISGAGNEIKIW
eukprot:CAMPEP_0170524534 /NCGR_PEP_ID=MMETSP0209-20121228/9969_1 /TAXON_ID=665100 ORGANISM="Litonotus pictus, Strain P1" /NCGR_SAMPLE_ID=MMETSP0209 /ASSEMBLY_ACC=CAM_ASM_000301 /LENGTH=290 /DNA_ID=CAMNT_0010813265 /DNA_START=729 /DNA_END=1598 /DNA_ORIENTATION=-